VLVALASSAAAVHAAATVPPPPEPRLEGPFLLEGHVTVAINVAGERVGQKVVRTWTFTGECPAGPCHKVTLVRQRAGGTDTVRLRRKSHGYYVGTGRYFAPLRCGNTTYAKGQRVPFTIGVRVTGSAVANGVLIATHVRASYTNRARRNLTRCFAVLGHDAAAYHGHLNPPPPPPTG
jgi:hypothetical protein